MAAPESGDAPLVVTQSRKNLLSLGESLPQLHAYGATVSRPSLRELRHRRATLPAAFAAADGDAAGASAPAPATASADEVKVDVPAETPNAVGFEGLRTAPAIIPEAVQEAAEEVLGNVPAVSAEDEDEITRAISRRLTLDNGAENKHMADQAARAVAAAAIGGALPGVDAKKGGKPVKAPVKFGMWDGVLARCLLNIWGVILFLRVGWMVGYAGIGLSTVVILVSVAVTTISTLSLSAICTNGKVEGGGAYYMISRALGPRFGGSIGCLFYSANAVAIALYLIGFAETLVQQGLTLVGEEFDLRLIALITLAVLFGLCMVGVDWVIKVQLGLLAVLVVSISSFIIGCFMTPGENSTPAFMGFGTVSANTNVSQVGFATTPIVTPDDGAWLRNWGPDWTADAANFPKAASVMHEIDGDVNFAAVLSVFFPAVTGIMAGANISGDLKDPARAIPVGTIWAVGISTIVYVFLAGLIGAAAARTVVYVDGTYGGLLHDSILMARLSFWPPLVYVGIYAATLSSALASLVGAPRILQAVARDGLFPGLEFFAKGSGASQEPVRGYVLSSVVAIGCIAIGNLNAIAPLITNFFMATYALVNYACFMASHSKTPGWRPTFKHYNKWVSLLGAVACFCFMMFLNVTMGVVTCIVGAMLFKYIEMRTKSADNIGDWGAAEESSWYLEALTTLKQLDHARGHVKNWRPQLLVLSGNPEERMGIESAARHFMRKAFGCTIFAEIVQADADDMDARERFTERQEYLEDHVRHFGLAAFAHVITAPSYRSGVQTLLQVSGLGRLRPNTALMGYKNKWPTQSDEDLAQYVGTIGDCFDMDVGVVVVTDHAKYDSMTRLISADVQGRNFMNTLTRTNTGLSHSGEVKNIDVWWLTDDGGLTLLMPHLLMRSRWFRHRFKLRLMCPAAPGVALEKEISRNKLLLKNFRIELEVCGVPNGKDDPSAEAMAKFEEYGVATEGDMLAVTKSYLRYGELIREHSGDSAMVFASLPVPPAGVDPRLYLTWTDALSQQLDAEKKPRADKPVVVLMRGNQHSVMTFMS